MDEKYSVYVKTDASGYITAVHSSAFLADVTGWVKIGEGAGDRYHHAQGNYFPQPIVTDGGAYRYKLVNGAPAECTAAEIAAQEAALVPAPEPAADESIWDAMAAAYNEGVQNA